MGKPTVVRDLSHNILQVNAQFEVSSVRRLDNLSLQTIDNKVVHLSSNSDKIYFSFIRPNIFR